MEVIEAKALVPRNLGEHKCTGKGNKLNKFYEPCGSTFRVGLTSVYKTERRDYTGEVTERFVTFMCPNCGNETDTDLSTSDVLDIESKKEWMHRNRLDSMWSPILAKLKPEDPLPAPASEPPVKRTRVAS